MKRFSQLNGDINEACVTSDVNPGNTLNTGVMNHYTPIENILTNVKNIYGSRLGIVASVAEDGFSLKLNSSKFNTKESLNEVLYKMPDRTTISLNDYICQQGLTKVTTVDLGGAKVIYYSPADIKAAEPGKEANKAAIPVKEMQEMNIEEAELIDISNEPFDYVFESDDDDEELESIVQKELSKLIDEKDKMKAARKFGEIIAQQIDLPQEFYFAGVTDADGKQSIALRWRYLKRRPNKKSVERKRSLINIYSNTKDGIWVQDFDEKSMFKLPEEVEKLIKNVLDAMGAEETDDKCVWDLSGNKDKSSKKDDKNDKKDKEDEEDFEDDDSRGDNSENDDKDKMMGL